MFFRSCIQLAIKQEDKLLEFFQNVVSGYGCFCEKSTERNWIFNDNLILYELNQKKVSIAKYASCIKICFYFYYHTNSFEKTLQYFRYMKCVCSTYKKICFYFYYYTNSFEKTLQYFRYMKYVCSTYKWHFYDYYYIVLRVILIKFANDINYRAL